MAFPSNDTIKTDATDDDHNGFSIQKQNQDK